MQGFIIEICPNGGHASPCTMQGESLRGSAFESDMADCNSSGDCEPACRYMLQNYAIQFRIVAKDESGKYENRLATDSELQETCQTIYFESESDFSDPELCKIYLIWQAVSEMEGESD